ncbi:MAG: polyprenyl synthetase family protein [Bacteroidaceae bacterium]|nr:polyprenyl synthetase family protein [Bacteroidaceae bacterium]
MNILSTIQGTIGEELSLLNRTLVEKLHTSNELMNRIIDRYLLTKGKQIRPILIMLCARMIDDITPTTILSAAAIELMHNASLIHDDVIDTSLYRRGEPTINAAEDNRMAILMGDHFVSCALQCGVETGKMDIVAAMGRLGQELAHGEIDQIDNARSHRLSEDAYFSVIRRKTASLFRACMHVGALSVDADERTRLQLETSGELLGLCFQIKDDIFDYYEEYAVGKPTGNDLREGKVTLPLLYAITHHDDAENKRMRQLLEKEQLDATEIGALIEYAKANGGIEYAYQRMQELREEAVRTLEGFPHNDTYQALVSILDYTIARDK